MDGSVIFSNLQNAEEKVPIKVQDVDAEEQLTILLTNNPNKDTMSVTPVTENRPISQDLSRVTTIRKKRSGMNTDSPFPIHTQILP